MAIEERVFSGVEVAWLKALCAFADEASQKAAMTRFVRERQCRSNPDSSSEPNSISDSNQGTRCEKLISELAQQAGTELQLEAIV